MNDNDWSKSKKSVYLQNSQIGSSRHRVVLNSPQDVVFIVVKICSEHFRADPRDLVKIEVTWGQSGSELVGWLGLQLGLRLGLQFLVLKALGVATLIR